MLKDIILVGAGGFAGSVFRYLISAALIANAARLNFPVGTLLVNIVGALLIGIFFVTLPQGNWYYLCISGFCGGFTTFSAFSLEALQMLRTHNYSGAALYIAASVLVCILFVWLGVMIGNRFIKPV